MLRVRSWYGMGWIPFLKGVLFGASTLMALVPNKRNGIHDAKEERYNTHGKSIWIETKWSSPERNYI